MAAATYAISVHASNFSQMNVVECYLTFYFSFVVFMNLIFAIPIAIVIFGAVLSIIKFEGKKSSEGTVTIVSLLASASLPKNQVHSVTANNYLQRIVRALQRLDSFWSLTPSLIPTLRISR